MPGLEVLGKGLVVGLAVAAPVGPIGLLCIRRTLTNGRLAGLASGFGAAVADGFYGFLAATGFALSGLLLSHGTIMQVGGGLLLLALGAGTFRKGLARRAAKNGAELKRASAIGAFASTFVLTVANPSTILSFVALISALGVGGGPAAAGPYLLVAGVFLGSALWWLGLVHATYFVQARISPRVMRLIDLGSGLLFIGWGLWAIGADGRFAALWN